VVCVGGLSHPGGGKPKSVFCVAQKSSKESVRAPCLVPLLHVRQATSHMSAWRLGSKRLECREAALIWKPRDELAAQFFGGLCVLWVLQRKDTPPSPDAIRVPRAFAAEVFVNRRAVDPEFPSRGTDEVLVIPYLVCAPLHELGLVRLDGCADAAEAALAVPRECPITGRSLACGLFQLCGGKVEGNASAGGGHGRDGPDGSDGGVHEDVRSRYSRVGATSVVPLLWAMYDGMEEALLCRGPRCAPMRVFPALAVLMSKVDPGATSVWHWMRSRQLPGVTVPGILDAVYGALRASCAGVLAEFLSRPHDVKERIAWYTLLELEKSASTLLSLECAKYGLCAFKFCTVVAQAAGPGVDCVLPGTADGSGSESREPLGPDYAPAPFRSDYQATLEHIAVHNAFAYSWPRGYDPAPRSDASLFVSPYRPPGSVVVAGAE